VTVTSSFSRYASLSIATQPVATQDLPAAAAACTLSDVLVAACRLADLLQPHSGYVLVAAFPKTAGTLAHTFRAMVGFVALAAGPLAASSKAP
jgi:hypothetical protein